jgi:hypothetical protein
MPQLNETLLELSQEKAGVYLYTDFDTSLPLKPPVSIEQNVYVGQWLDHIRQGQGRQVWPDGMFYEGYSFLE